MSENTTENEKRLMVEIIASQSYVSVQINFNNWVRENPNVELYNAPIYQMTSSGGGNVHFSITIFYFRTV